MAEDTETTETSAAELTQEGKRQNVIRLAFGGLPKKQQGAAPGSHRVRVAAKLQINRRQDLPPAAILGIFLQMGLDLTHHAFNCRLLLGRLAAPRHQIVRRQLG